MSQNSHGEILRIYSEKTLKNIPIIGAAEVLAKANSEGLQVAVVTTPTDENSRRVLAKRHHDLKAALRTLNFTARALEKGYRFDDEKAQAKIEAISRAVEALEQEVSALAPLFLP